MKTIVLVIVALFLIQCATNRVIHNANHVSTKIHSVDSLKVTLPEYDLLIESPELKTKEGQSYQLAKNSFSKRLSDWFQPHPESKWEKLELEEISHHGGIYFQPGHQFKSWSLYLSKELPVVFKLYTRDYTGIPKEIEYVEYDNSFGISIPTAAGRKFYQSIPTELSKKSNTYDLQSCESCREKVRKTIRIPNHSTENSLILAIVDDKGVVEKIYQMNTKKYGFRLNDYLEVNSIESIKSNFIWYPVIPFAFVWDVLTSPIQFIMNVLSIIALSKSYS